MTYEEFKQYIKDHIREYLSDKLKDADIQVVPTNKINKTYDALMIKDDNSGVIPTLYINNMFEAYESGQDVDDILVTAADIYNMKTPEFETAEIFDPEYIKEHLGMRLINKEWNKEILEDVPYTDLGDFAITYHVEIDSKDGACSYMLHNNHIEELGFTEGELHDIALDTCAEKHPVVIKDISAVLTEMMGDDFLPEDPDMNNTGMLVVTNEDKMYGASVMAYENTLDDIAELVGGDFVILPSSLHEIIVLKDDGSMDYGYMKDMVEEVNATQVEQRDRLSDSVYHYDSTDRVMEKCEDYVMRKKLENTRGMSINDQLAAGDKAKEKDIKAPGRETLVKSNDIDI